MANPFQINGAVSEKQSKFAPLLINEFFTGQYSNSSPLREAAVPLLYQRFYSGSRYDTIRYGSNVEISPRLTIIRRPGCSIYNSQTFANVLTYYSFRVFNPYTQTESIRVIVDTAAAVYDGTGPSGKTLLFTKSANAKQTSFQSLGNTLYAGDGVSTWQYLWAPAWTANTTYNTGNTILDPNGNIQQLTSISFTNFSAGTGQSVYLSSNVASIAWNNTSLTDGGFPAQWTALQLAQLPGETVQFSGFTATFLNGESAIILTATNSFIHVGSTGYFSAQITFDFTNANYPLTSDSGTISITSGTGESGGSTPSWATGIGSTTADGNLTWTNKGPAVRNWGIVAPKNAPLVANVVNTNSGTAWAANTYYSANLCIVDSNSNVQLLTTGGTTGSSVPTWATSPGTTTADSAGGGTAVWTCQGPATRATTQAYAVNAIIAVQYSYTQTVVTGSPVPGKPIDGGPPGGGVARTVTYGPYFYLFQCSVAGTSSSASTATLTWQNGTIIDGTVTWVKLGPWITRTTSSTAAGTGAVKGNIGNSQLVSLATQIVDSNGNAETIVSSGESGATAPTWATASGSQTTDNQVKWLNAGPTTSANTGAWQYGYAFMDSVSEHISSMSPPSNIILLGAGDIISVTGSGDPNFLADGSDTIVIYRTVQGAAATESGGVFFQLTTIPAPLNGAPWSYSDNTPDPPATGAILNEFIEADVIGNNAPPPAGLTNLTFYLSRIFGSAGTFQYYSGVSGQLVGVGADSWSAENFMEMPELVSISWAASTGLLIFTTQGVYFSQGIDGNGNPNTPTRILTDVGLLSQNLFTVNGSIPVILSADSQMLALDPSAGLTRYSDPIADSANGMGAFSTTASYLTWHVSGIDTAFYLADGSTGWFKLCPTAAPESGFTWSPKANITGGCLAVKSIETTPGVKNLLIGSPASGPILKRDLTTNADNGTSYLANWVIGSLVFAQPGQCAEIESVSTFAVAIGSKLQIGILGSEIAPTLAVPFEVIPASVPEPPFLNAPQSVYADRWYFNQISAPIWVQHLQIQFSWPAENAQNELLSFAVYGCVHI